MEDVYKILYTKVMSTSDELKLKDSFALDPIQVCSNWVKTLNLKFDIGVIHIAGTKGKGSTASFCESLLRNNGLSTGLYTSPHLIDVKERFRINGDIVSEEDFLKSFWYVWNCVEEKTDVSKGLPPPGFFRFLTLVAFHLFSALKVDAIVLEVGIGGRLDATNVIPSPIVCGITLIDLDHTEVLGDTLEKIAFEKAGIAKVNIPIFVTDQVESVLHVIRDHALTVDAPFSVAKPLDLWLKHPPIILGLNGNFQHENAALAVQLCHYFLLDYYKKSSNENFKFGLLDPSNNTFLSKRSEFALENTKWAGRCQTISFSPKTNIYLDGAHTPKSLDAVVEWYKSQIIKDKRGDASFTNILIFHGGIERKVGVLLAKLVEINFNYVVFVPPSMFRPSRHTPPSASHLLSEIDDELFHGYKDEVFEDSTNIWSKTLANVWRELQNKIVKKIKATEKDKADEQHILTKNNMNEVISLINAVQEEGRVNVLVTGSLYIIGDMLSEMKVSL